MILKRIFLLAIVFSIYPNLISCDRLFISHTNPLNIEKIVPRKNGKQVYIAGEVIKAIYLVNNGAYLIRDSTDEIWIYTKAKLPLVGDRVSIKGQIESQTLPFNKEEIYLQEIEIKPYSKLNKKTN